MARLSNHVKSSIIALRNAGLSWNEITNQLNVKTSTARSIVQKFKKTKSVINKRSSGRPKKYTKAGERRLIRILKDDRNQSAKNILAQWNSSLPRNRQISLTTARFIIRKHGFQGRAPAKKIALSHSMRKRREQWCKERKLRSEEQWKTYLFSDEVRIGTHCDGNMHVYRRTGERYNNDCILLKSNDRKSMLFWGFISSTGVGSLIKCYN